MMDGKTCRFLSAEERQAADEFHERAEAMLQAQRDEQERQRLRDQFAAAALTGLLAFPGHQVEIEADKAAMASYAFADAMLRQRDLAQ